MAEVFLQLLLDNLVNLIQAEVGLIMGVEKEMNKLSSTLTAIQAVLEDAEQKQLESKSIRDWLRKLNDLTYEIDDILDECATEVSMRQTQSRKSSRYGLKTILFRRKIGTRMKEVTGKLDVIAAEREKFHLREMGIERKISYAAVRETASVLNESEHIYGRDEEKEKIVDILVKEGCDEQQLAVLPIIGIGGLGKTTLARLVFNDNKVDEHFDKKIWVCVSDNFDMKTLIKAVIESATGKGSCSDLAHLDALQRRLWELLNQKKFFLVLDDVWNDDQEKWGALKNAVACGSKGAKILVTTRLKKVADITGTLPAHHMAELSEENCWLLFKERAFGQETKELLNLESIGRQIVKKCCGVPLAAKALGGLVRFKRTEKEWHHILDSEIWNLPQEETMLLPALRLSYHHLPSKLKRCFSYCAVFPKDTKIRKKDLIFLWMAHGYISSNGVLEEEDIGNGIWNELVLRSLFQDVTNGRETLFTMHDLVHDLAQSIMENRVPGLQTQCNDKMGKIRQVNLLKHHVAFPSRIRLEIDLSFILMNLNRLRALDASWTRTDSIPSTIGNLKHLRYLNLSSTDICTLPDAICSLWNLKILNLNFCFELIRLPKQMRDLRSMRHLLLDGCSSLKEMPPKIGELSSLKTLSMFIVGCGKDNRLGELQFLNIGGKLKIRHLERVENHMDANMANLHKKENLDELFLSWEDCTSETEETMDDNILKALEPHPNIKIINVEGFRGRYFPQWRSLVNLVEFSLKDCPNCLSLPQLGQLPHLRIMRLRSLVVEYIIVEDDIEYGTSKFSSLEELSLYRLNHLKGFSKKILDIEIFPRLQKLDIHECSSLIFPPEMPPIQVLRVGKGCNLTSLSRLDFLTELEIYGGNIPNEVLENLTNLRSLSIAHETSLCAQGLRGLKSLETLAFIMCERLTCLPPHGWSPHLTTLKDLTINNCSEFVELPEDIRYLKSVTSLELFHLPKMDSLPEALKHLASLRSLRLDNLPELTTIPAFLTSLVSLEIWKCLKLTSLPDSIKQMKNLTYLSIELCPELERRCQKEKGEDWHKIAHIDSVSIGSWIF